METDSNFVAGHSFAFEDPSRAERYAQRFNSEQAQPSDRGVPVGTNSHVKLEVRGNRYQSVRIVDVRLSSLERRPMISEALICPPTGKGATGGDYEVIDFRLDDQEPVGRYVTPDGKVTTTPYADRRRNILTKNESMGFLLQFHTSSHHVRFKIVIDYEFGSNKTGSITLDDNGKPFEFTAMSEKPELAGPSAEGGGFRRPDYKALWIPSADDRRVVNVNPGTATKRCG